MMDDPIRIKKVDPYPMKIRENGKSEGGAGKGDQKKKPKEKPTKKPELEEGHIDTVV